MSSWGGHIGWYSDIFDAGFSQSIHDVHLILNRQRAIHPEAHLFLFLRQHGLPHALGEHAKADRFLIQ